jgi:1-acyl-sn-glycerol-3-phosphate acyltransferase
MGENWISVNTALLNGAGSIDWRLEGADALSRDEWYLVISNHQTWVDILVLQGVLNRRIPFLKFFIKHQLVWFPILGIAWWAMDMPFMKRYSAAYLARNPHMKGKDFEEVSEHAHIRDQLYRGHAVQRREAQAAQ